MDQEQRRRLAHLLLTTPPGQPIPLTLGTDEGTAMMTGESTETSGPPVEQPHQHGVSADAVIQQLLQQIADLSYQLALARA